MAEFDRFDGRLFRFGVTAAAPQKGAELEFLVRIAWANRDVQGRGIARPGTSLENVAQGQGGNER